MKLILPLALLLLASVATAQQIPVSVHNGRLVAEVENFQVQLQDAASRWEGSASRVEVSKEIEGFSILFHLDVTNTQFWLDLELFVRPDGGVDVLGWQETCGALVGVEWCESYGSLDEMRKSRQWLAVDAVAELNRVGVFR